MIRVCAKNSVIQIGTIRYHMSRNLLWCYAMPRSRSSRLASDTSAAAELVALRAGKGASTRDCKNERRTPGPPRTACLLFESSYVRDSALARPMLRGHDYECMSLCT